MRRRHLRTVLAAAFAVQSSLLVLQPAASNAAANPGVDVLAVRSSSDHDVSLVAALHPMPLAPLDRKTVTATAGGTDLPTDVTPVLSGRTGIGLVIDASADGAAALHDGGLSGAAGFLLQMPPGARTAVVADRRPPAVAARTAVGVSAALQATSGVTSTGARATSEALTLSVRQLPAWPGSQPVLVLFTAAPDAGGEAASALGERLQGAHAILAVITTSADSGYWSRVATSTGGFAISTRPAQAITAFDAAADALRARYQVTFTRPRTAATQATLRFDAAGRQTVVAVALPPVQAGRAAAGSGSAGAGRWLWVSAAALLAAAAAVAMLLRRRPRPGSRDPDDVRPEVSPEVSPDVSAAEDHATPPTPPATTSVPVASPRIPRAVAALHPRDARLVPPEERVLAHRERSWAAQLPDVDPALLRWTAAAATIAGGDTEGDADALLALLPALAGADARALRGRLARWWADAVPGARLLNPLQPDRLGEHLAALTLTGMQDAAPGLLDGLLTLPSDRQVGATLDLLARTHAGHPQLAQLTDEAVLRNFFRLARRATGSPGAGHGGQGGAPAADALLRLIAPSVVQRLVPGDDVPADRRERERSVSIACTHLGELATVAGRDGEAHALLDAALRIDQALAASAAGEVQYRREVAADQLRLAHLHAAAGRASLAESGYRRALDTLRELAEQDADNPAHWRQMVTAHTRLADLDRDGERVALADAGYRRAVDAVQALVTLDPENASYRRELAAAYVRLAELDAAAGWVAQAESGYRRATELNEWLVRHDPGNADDRRRLEADRLKLTTFAGDRTDNDDGRP